jgi:protein SCO1
MMRLAALIGLGVAVLAGQAPDSWQRGDALFHGEEALTGKIRGHDEDLPAEAVRCSNCHEVTGGRAPHLDRSLLLEERQRRGGPPSRYDAAAFCKLLRTGADPSFIVIAREMPVYELDDVRCNSLWIFLTEKKTMMESDVVSRRSFLQAVLLAPPAIRGHGKINPPAPVPDVELVRYDGARTRFLPVVKGRVTAVHLMFTSCGTTCPIQAAIFRHVQDSMPGMEKSGIQLLSLSIDPENDTPGHLGAWLRHYHAGPGWIAAAPVPRDLPPVREFFGKGSESSDHSTQVHILDRGGNLVWRTYELPTPGEIVALLRRVART